MAKHQKKIFAVACKYDEDQYQKMKKVIEACIDADVQPPSEASDFFDGDEFSENEIIELPYMDLDGHYEILIEDIPSKFHKIKIMKQSHNQSFELNGKKI